VTQRHEFPTPPGRLFLQNVIAVIWDFDKTLISGYMQEPLFEEYGIEAKGFWDEVNSLAIRHRRNGLHNVSTDTMYLNHMLTYVASGKLPGLNNQRLRELGARIKFYEGLPEFFATLRQHVAQTEDYKRHEILLEHYIVSTGLYEMIMGSAISEFVDGVWGCEFVELVPPPGYIKDKHEFTTEQLENRLISQVGYVIDNTSKTRAIFEINKGSNKLGIDVNDAIRPEERRVPFQNMIYIADGPSDVPVFSILNQYGGQTYAVFQRGNEKELAQVDELRRQARIIAFGEADYRPGSQTAMWITRAVDKVAARIVQTRERVLSEELGHAPRHITE
jgi:hypothetical protein